MIGGGIETESRPVAQPHFGLWIPRQADRHEQCVESDASVALGKKPSRNELPCLVGILPDVCGEQFERRLFGPGVKSAVTSQLVSSVHVLARANRHGQENESRRARIQIRLGGRLKGDSVLAE